MAQQMKAGVTATKVQTDEPPFVPGAKRIEVVLKPLPGEEQFLPPAAPVTPLPPLERIPTVPPLEAERPLIFDVETTGIMPFDSRIICITVVDPMMPDEIITFVDENEEVMIKDFINYLNTHDHTQLVGYNVSFDYRFIFAKCMAYRIKCEKLVGMNLYDLMQVMKQVKTEYVFTLNKPGTLDQWTEYFFGEKEPLSTEEQLKAWKEGRISDIVESSRKGVELTLLLWALIEYVEGRLHE